MDSEQVELDRELSWTPRWGFSDPEFYQRPPAGFTAMTSLSMVYSLLAFAITGRIWSSVAAQPAGSSDLHTAMVVLSYLFDVLLAIWFSRRTWIAIGPSARRAIRPTMVFGPWPPIIVGALAALMFFAFGSAALSGRLFHQRPLKGVNWQMLESRTGATYPQALAQCAALGPGWGVPAAAELPSLSPTFEGFREAEFWLEEDGNDAGRVVRECHGMDCKMVPRRVLKDEKARAAVLCYRR